MFIMDFVCERIRSNMIYTLDSYKEGCRNRLDNQVYFTYDIFLMRWIAIKYFIITPTQKKYSLLICLFLHRMKRKLNWSKCNLKRRSWCNSYRRMKWIRQHVFKFRTRLFAFHIAVIPLGKVWIQLFSPQLGQTVFFKLDKGISLGEGKTLNSNLLNSAENWSCVIFWSCGEVYIYIYTHRVSPQIWYHFESNYLENY